MADFDWDPMERWTREWNQNAYQLPPSSGYTSRGRRWSSGPDLTGGMSEDELEDHYINFDLCFPESAYDSDDRSHSSTDSHSSSASSSDADPARASSPLFCATGRNPYKLLGLEYGATNGEIKKSYRRLVLRLHPDKRPAGQSLAELDKVERSLQDVMMARCFLLDEEHSDARKKLDARLARRWAKRQPPPLPSQTSTRPTPSGGSRGHLGQSSEGVDASDDDNVDDSSGGKNGDGDGSDSDGDSEDGPSREDGKESRQQSENETAPYEKELNVCRFGAGCQECLAAHEDVHSRKLFCVACSRFSELREKATPEDKYQEDLTAQRERDSKTLFSVACMYETRPKDYLAAYREWKEKAALREKNDHLRPSSMQRPISTPLEWMKISDAPRQQTRATSASTDTPLSPASMGVSDIVKDMNPNEGDSSAITSESILDPIWEAYCAYFECMHEIRRKEHLTAYREWTEKAARREKSDHLRPSSTQRLISTLSERMKISGAPRQQTRATSASTDNPVSPASMVVSDRVRDLNPDEGVSSAIKSESIFDSNWEGFYATLERDSCQKSPLPPQPPWDDLVSEKCMKVRGFRPASISMASSRKRKGKHTAAAIVESAEPSSESLRAIKSPSAKKKYIDDFFSVKRMQVHRIEPASTARSAESPKSQKRNEAQAKSSSTKKKISDFFLFKRMKVHRFKPASTTRSTESSKSRERNETHVTDAIDESSEPLFESLRTTQLSSTRKRHGISDDFFSDAWMKVYRFEPASTTKSSTLSRSSKRIKNNAATAFNESAEPLSESLRTTKLSLHQKCHGSVEDFFADAWMKVYRFKPASTSRSTALSGSSKRNETQVAAAIYESVEPFSESLRTTKLSSSQNFRGSGDDFFSDGWMKVYRPASMLSSTV
jgi:curved DNA-binding protein CbpA